MASSAAGLGLDQLLDLMERAGSSKVGGEPNGRSEEGARLTYVIAEPCIDVLGSGRPGGVPGGLRL